MRLVDLDARISAVILIMVMLIASELGHRMGRLAAKRAGNINTRVDDAIQAVFALIVGFSFAGAAAKHDRRVWLMVDEATAIGDFATASSVVAEPERSELRQTIRDYVEVRLTTANTFDTVELGELVARTRRFEGEMQRNVAQIVAKQNTPSVHTALVMTLNATTTGLENRIAALSDHIPPTVVLMLFVSAIMATFSVARVQGIGGPRQPLPMLVFITLVAVVIYVTLDLEQPRQGIVRVPTHALESVRSTLGP
jgi:hypothetical protein